MIGGFGKGEGGGALTGKSVKGVGGKLWEGLRKFGKGFEVRAEDIEEQRLRS